MSASNALRIRYMIDNCEIAGPNITAIETVCGEVWNNRAATGTTATTTSPPAKAVKHRKPMSAETKAKMAAAAKLRAANAAKKPPKTLKTLAAAS